MFANIRNMSHFRRQFRLMKNMSMKSQKLTPCSGLDWWCLCKCEIWIFFNYVIHIFCFSNRDMPPTDLARVQADIFIRLRKIVYLFMWLSRYFYFSLEVANLREGSVLFTLQSYTPSGCSAGNLPGRRFLTGCWAACGFFRAVEVMKRGCWLTGYKYVQSWNVTACSMPSICLAPFWSSNSEWNHKFPHPDKTAQIRPGTSYIKLYRYITKLILTIISLEQEPAVFKQYLQLLNHT